MDVRFPMTVDLEFCRLDRRVIWLWRITHFIFFSVVMGGLFFGGAGMAGAKPGMAGWLSGGWLGLATLSFVVSITRPNRLYLAWGYRIDERVLETRSGLLFKVIRLIPLSRLQYVDLHRGPLERLFGLSTLLLHTAGTHEAAIRIPGLDSQEAIKLRDHLVDIGGGDDGV